MDKKSNGEKAAFCLAEEEFYKILEQKRSQENSSFEDPALEQFVKEPTESETDLLLKVQKISVSISCFILFAIMLIFSTIGGLRGSMEQYVAFPISILSLIGLFILIKDVANKKKNIKHNSAKNTLVISKVFFYAHKIL